jgi:hypothetical protein
MNFTRLIVAPEVFQQYCVELLNSRYHHSHIFGNLPKLSTAIKDDESHKYHIYNKEFKDKYTEHLIYDILKTLNI